MDLWQIWTYRGVGSQISVSASTTGATLNSHSLRVQFPPEGNAPAKDGGPLTCEPLIFDIGRMTGDDFNDMNDAFFAHTNITMDITWNPADWVPLDPQLPITIKVKLSLNTMNGGYDLSAPDIDTGNPDNPGVWDSATFTTVHTRQVAWGLEDEKVQMGNDPGDWFEIILNVKNINVSGYGVLYLDNIRFNTLTDASTPKPGFNEQNLDILPTLTWTAGALAKSHTVYFGTDFNEVNEATVDVHPNVTATDTTSKSLAITELLDFFTTYYWRVDEVNNTQLWPGAVWKFTTGGFQLIDGFESYKNSGTPGDNRIFETWRDGNKYTNPTPPGGTTPGNGTRMTVGVDTSPYGPETTTVYKGYQSLPLTYANSKSPYYSETDRTFASPQDFTTAHDGQAFVSLDMQIHGRYLSPGTFTNDGNNQYTVIGSGKDIYGGVDEFHFVYQPVPLEGEGSISAKIERVENVHQSAKAGVMIRNTLEAGGVYAGVFSLPNGDIVFQYRDVGRGATEILRPENHTFTLPYWVKISTNGSYLTPYMSADGNDWVQIADPEFISMIDYVVVGLAVSSHMDAGTGCEAVFSNVKIEGTEPTLDTSLDVGLPKNDPSNLYVRLEDNSGITETFNYQDNPNGVLIEVWGNWKLFSIPLSGFSVVDLTQIKKMVIGVGDKQLGSDGKLYVDDIRLTLP